MLLSQLNDALLRAVAAFCESENNVSVIPLGKGNINETYLVATRRQKFVLQRINGAVFPNPAGVAANFSLITRHIIKASETRSLGFLCAQPVLTLAGKIFHQDEQGNCWRAQSYVKHIPHHRVQLNKNSALQLGHLLAQFHLLTEDLDITRFSEPLPGFHITPGYLNQFDEAASLWRGSTSSDLSCCFQFVDKYRMVADRLEAACGRGDIQRRIIHGDPKLDNIIFATSSGKALGMFDLDTTGPGLLQYDLGDCLRSCCNRAGEGAQQWQQVRFDLDICEAVLNGYLQSAGDNFSPWDRNLIYDGVLVISFELGLRFLTDHLRGDVYFRGVTPGQNLLRALGQFRLVESIAAQESTIRAVIDRLAC